MTAPQSPRARGSSRARLSWWSRHAPAIGVIARLLAFSAAFYALFLVLAIGQSPSRYLAMNASLGSTVLGWLGQQTRAVGASILSARFAVTITPECAAGEFLAFFCAGVLTFPALLSRKVLGLVLGVAALVLLNVVRIVMVFLVGIFWPDLFTTMHEEVWPSLLVLATLALIFGWMRWATRDAGVDSALQSKTVPARFAWLMLALGLLLMPWPGVPKLSDATFRRLGSSMFSDSAGQREVTFESLDPHHSRIEVVNRDLMAPDGTGPVRNLDLNAFSFLWRPCVLLLCLAWRMPPDVRRRFSFLGCGTICLLGYFYLTLSFTIWNESTEVSLVTLSPFWKQVANGLEMALAQLGILVPVFVWLWFAMKERTSLKANAAAILRDGSQLKTS